MTLKITNTLFNTNPILLHAPGPMYADWHRVTAEALTPIAPVDCRDVTVIVYDGPDRPNKPNGIAKRSLDRLGVKSIVMSSDAPGWGTRDKHRMTVEALESITTPYTMGVDSGDVIFTDNPQIAADRFREHFACDLLFMSTGSRCWPELPQFVDYAIGRHGAAEAHGRYWMNTGAFIGHSDFCRHYFAMMMEYPYVIPWNTDQCVIMDAWPQWYPRVQLDYRCEIFQWANEDRRVMRLARWEAPRQHALAKWIKRLYGNITGAEIGVFDGHTSEFLLRHFPGLRLWMVDQWQAGYSETDNANWSQDDFERIREAAEWWTAFADDRRHVLRDPSTSAVTYFADRSLDFAFIDADHSYESVRQDLEVWSKKIRRGGLLTGHDYSESWPGVVRAVNEFADGREIERGDDSTWCLMMD